MTYGRIVEVGVVQFERKATKIYGRDINGQPVQERVSRGTGHAILRELDRWIDQHPESQWSKDHTEGDER